MNNNVLDLYSNFQDTPSALDGSHCFWEESLVKTCDKDHVNENNHHCCCVLDSMQGFIGDQVQCGRFTFADFQVNRIIDVLGQFLAASSLFKHKALEMKHQHWRQLLQGHSPTDLNLTVQNTRAHGT